MSELNTEPKFFIEAKAILYLLDKASNIQIDFKGEELKVSTTTKTKSDEGFKALNQDGIIIFYPDSLEIDVRNQIKIDLKKSLFGSKLIVDNIERFSGGGFLGTRGCV